MQFFRRIIKSKFGGIIAIAFLGLVAFAFAAGDITGSGGLNVVGPSSGEVASIGSESLTVAELQDRVQRVFDRARQDNPEMTMPQFLAQDGLKQVADQMIATKALIAFGQANGIRISKKLVDAEIASNPAFADATGAFSQSQFTTLLAQQRVSEKDLRDDLAGQIIQQQMLAAAAAGARAPVAMTPPYAAMLLEQRTGEMIAVPSAAFAPESPSNDKVLTDFYTAHPDEFTVPEQRTLRYALISRSRFNAASDPTEDEIKQAYESRQDEYGARESRDISQLVLLTESQAREIAAKAQTGTSLSDLASAAGLSASQTAGLDQATLAQQSNAALAKAAFAAEKGALVGPIRTPLGWTLLRVTAIKNLPGKTLAQARGALVPELKERKAQNLFADFVNEIDGRLGDGATLADIAEAEALTIVETPQITGEGRMLRDPAYQADPTVRALLATGFGMTADDDPVVIQIAANETAALVAPGTIVPAGPPPFADVRAGVEIAWRLQQGSGKARDVAQKISAALNKGLDVAAAIKEAGAKASQVERQPLDARRVQLNQSAGAVPPPLRVLFALREGSARVEPIERNQGFIVVRLDKVIQEDPTGNAELMQSTRAGLSNVLGGEYARQLVASIEQKLGVTRNPAAYASVEAALRQTYSGGQ